MREGKERRERRGEATGEEEAKWREGKEGETKEGRTAGCIGKLRKTVRMGRMDVTERRKGEE